MANIDDIKNKFLNTVKKDTNYNKSNIDTAKNIFLSRVYIEDLEDKERQRLYQEQMNNRSLEDLKTLKEETEEKFEIAKTKVGESIKDKNAQIVGKKLAFSSNNTSNYGKTISDEGTLPQYETNPLLKANEGVVNYINYTKTNDYATNKQTLARTWDERARAISDYEVKKAIEDEKNMSTLSKIAMTPVRGGASVFSALRGDLATESGQLPSYNEAFLQAQSENAKTGIGKLGYNVLGEIGKQTIAQALNFIVPGAGNIAYFGDIANDQYNNAINMGYSDKAALNYAILSTGTELAFERFVGAGSNFFGKKMGAENVISGVLSKFIKNKTTNDMLSAFLSEGTEEFLEEYLGEFNKQLTLDWADKGQNIDYSKIFSNETLGNAFESFLIGGIVGTTGATTQRVLTPKDVANYNQALYQIERENGKLSDTNKQILNNMVALSEEMGIPLTSKQIVDNFNNVKNAQMNVFKDSALELFPNLDEQSRKDYNNLINDVSNLIYITGVPVEFDPNLDILSEFDGEKLIINPTMTSMPIKTLLLKELGTNLVDNSTKQYILSYLKKNGVYDTLKRELLGTGEFDEANVDNEIISYELNRIFDSQEELNKLANNNKGFIDKVKSLVDNLVANITNNRTTKDAQYLRDLGNKLNISNDLLNNNLTGKELSNREIENIERMEAEEKTQNQLKEAPIKSNETKSQDVIKENGEQKGKTRKAYDTMQTSEKITPEEKKLAKQLKELDTFIPDSNEAQLKRADERISKFGLEKSYEGLKDAIENDRKVNQDDVALAERVLQYYRDNGTTKQKEDAIMTAAMVGTITGRSLQAMKLIYKMTPEGQVTWIQRSVDKLNKEMLKFNKNTKQQFTFTTDMKETILNSDSSNLEENVNKVCAELGQQVTMNILQKLDTWRYFAMLSAPTTHLRNIFGNIFMGKIQNVKNKIKGGIEDIYYGATGKEGERTATLKKTKKEYVDFAKEDLKNVDKQLGLNDNKYKESNNKIKENIRMFKSDTLEKYVKKGAIDKVNEWLTKEDNWALEKAYVRAMSQYLNANNVDLKNISKQQLAKARTYAVEEAKRATFHQDNSIATVLNTLENQNLATKIAVGGTIPFKKTPLNVAATALRYNPAGLLWSLTVDTGRLYNGQITANQYIDNIAQGLTGTAISLVGFALASMGWIRTTSDDNEDYDEDKGVQPYSIVLGDKTISLDWLSPTAVPLFVGAEVYNQLKNVLDDVPEDQREDKFITLMGLIEAGVSSLNPVSEMTMLSGVQNALKSYDKNYAKAFSQIGTNIAKNYASQIMPSLWGKFARITDDYERSTTSTKSGVVAKAVDQFVNQMKSKSIILRKTLPIKTDVWGNEVKQESNLLVRTALNLGSPAIVKNVRQTALDSEIERLYKATGESSVLPKTYIDKKLTYDKKDYQLTNSEYALYKKTLGEINYKNLNDLIESPEYKNLSDSQKVDIMKNIYQFDKDSIKIAYAEAKDIKYEDDKYKNPKEAVSLGGNVTDYYIYNAMTNDDKLTTYDKKSILKKMNISDTSKSAIYESGTSKSTNDLYQVLKESNVNINDYLDYLSIEFKADKREDGSTISGSKASKQIDYMNNSNLTYEQKLLILARDMSPSSTQKDYIVYRINDSNLTQEQKIELYKSMNWIKVDDYGNVRW